MKIYNLENFKKGWFIGNFEPSIIQTPQFEVAYHKHAKGEKLQSHFHKIANELTLVTKGKIRVNDKIMIQGNIFLLEPYEVSIAEIIEDCELVVVKTPSATNDKYGI